MNEIVLEKALLVHQDVLYQLYDQDFRICYQPYKVMFPVYKLNRELIFIRNIRDDKQH
jgi:hypothetical protein